MEDSSTNNSNLTLVWRGQWLGWLCLSTLALFTWLPNNYYLIVSWPWIIFAQIGFLGLGVWFIWMLRQFEIPFKSLGYGFDAVVALTGVTLILSALVCQFKGVAAWNISITFYYGLLLYVLVNWLQRGALTISRLWVGLWLTGVVAGVIGLCFWPLRYTPDDPRNAWPLGHPNFLAGYVLLVLPLVFFWSLARQGWQRIAGLGSSILLLIILYTTSSRGGFLGLLVLALVSAGFWIAQSQGKQRRTRLIILSIALVIIVLMLLSNSRVKQIINISSPQNNNTAVQVRIDGESQDRLLMWEGAGNIFKTHPLLGIGPGNMARVYDLYRPLKAGLSLTTLQELHSTPMQILGELGLMGLAAYGLFLGCYFRLWFRLYGCLSEPKQRYLLYGLGSSLLAYTVSSLTDYQLDNIAISGTLVGLVALLITLANTTQLSMVKEISIINRRWYSLGTMAAIVLTVIIGIHIPAAMYLSQRSEWNFNQGKIEKAYQQASLAASLVPWDPIYHLQAGYEILKVRDSIKDAQLYQELTQNAITNFQNLIDQAAPNDVAFTQVLGMLYGEANKNQQAIYYLSHAVQLLPRSPLYTYYLLGKEYLKQGQKKQAIASLVIQGLIQPSFLTSPLWNELPLAEIREPVAKETIRLLSNLKQKTTDYTQIIDENIVLLSWWFQLPLGQVDKDKLSPITQALLLIDSSPEKALEIINTAIDKNPESEALLLLRAWIEPDKYLPIYFTQYSAQLSQQDKDLLKNSIEKYREVRGWLSSLVQNPKYSPKVALILTYRNYHGKNLSYIPLPSELEINLLVNKLYLFPDWPRVFPQLDELIYQVKNDFGLTVKSL